MKFNSDLYLESLVSSDFLMLNRKLLRSFKLVKGVYISELISRQRFCRTTNQLIEIEGKGGNWFYAQRDSITFSTTLSEHQQRVCTQFFEEEGMLEITFKESTDRKAFYRLNSKLILKKIEDEVIN